MKKYIAIINKELRFILPILIAAGILFYLYCLDMCRYFRINDYMNNILEYYTGDTEHNLRLTGYIVSKLSGFNEILIVFFSIAAVLIALVQFWLPGLKGNWKFIMYRPISRTRQAVTMTFTAMLLIYIVAQLSWIAACNMLAARIPIPLNTSYYLWGLLYSLMPLVCYTATAIMGLLAKNRFIRAIPATMVLFSTVVIHNSQSNTIKAAYFLAWLIMTIPIILQELKTREY